MEEWMVLSYHNKYMFTVLISNYLPGRWHSKDPNRSGRDFFSFLSRIRVTLWRLVCGFWEFLSVCVKSDLSLMNWRRHLICVSVVGDLEIWLVNSRRDLMIICIVLLLTSMLRLRERVLRIGIKSDNSLTVSIRVFTFITSLWKDQSSFRSSVW
jgi:hypothetical protein